MIGFKNKIMKTQFDISELIENGKIQNELDFERALIADRKLRVLSKENSKFKSLRKQLRDLIEQYENQNWSTESNISDKKLRESEIAELIAEKERLFIQRRKELIRKKFKNLNLTQQDFGKILGHQSKSYISELITGVSPFSLKDLIVINRLLKINLSDLVPTFLAQSDRIKIRTTIKKLDNPKLKLSKEDLATALIL
jgi:transcriptional regulator with XRE-family HTH domain